MAIIGGTTGFYSLRFLLGVAEAGFQPGVVFYLSRWFPNRERAHATAVFNTAGPLAIAFGAPITGLLLGATDGAFGIAGWRWTFLLEGLPSILLGLTTLFYLPDRPVTATWLKPEERRILSDILDTEQAAQAQRDQGWFGWLRDPRILALAFVFFLLACGNYGIIFWLPQIVSGFGHLSSVQIGIITAIPFLTAALCLRAIARWSDRTGYRGSLVALCCLLAGLGFLGSAYASSPFVSLLCLSLVTTAIWGSFSAFWAMTGSMLSGPGTATGLAFVNSVGQFGGLLAPYTVGLIKDATGSYQLALVGMAVPCLLAALLTALIARR
jgi:ACS family tartrate transporter-like MFS transporter